MREATSGTDCIRGTATIGAGALAVGVGAAPVVVAVPGALVLNHQVVCSKRVLLAGLHVEGVVTAANQVTIYATGILTAGIVVPAAYIVDFMLLPLVP
jgi:hypothetical protein